MKILDIKVPRTLDGLVAELLDRRPTEFVEAWVFDDAEARKAAEARLAAAGVQGRIRSAYKPLLHFLLEDIDLSQSAKIKIVYPVHPATEPRRFLIEAYPLAGLLGDTEVIFAPGEEVLFYLVAATDRNGNVNHHRVFAPNIVVEDHIGESVLRCCGWLKIRDAEKHLQTDFETIFTAAVDTVKQHNWPKDAPYFDRLRVVVELPASDQLIDFCSEAISLREAMHEDLFFSLRECLGAGTRAGNGTSGPRPGQIVPDIRHAVNEPRIVMRIEKFEDSAETSGPDVLLGEAEQPLKMAQVRNELKKMGGERIWARSREGRIVEGRYKSGAHRPVVISAGEHANETSGPVGALRAAQRLAEDPSSHFAIVPVENVDGYELHQRLIRENPRHMHHAARYSALGDDLVYSDATPAYERGARYDAFALSSAKLHLNLHGYPSHECNRPMSGYLPRGFEDWMLPKGFYLIMSIHPGWEALGEAILDEVAERLSQDPDLVLFNKMQIDCMKAHAINLPFEIRHGLACSSYVETFMQAPLTLITETPDETVYGQDFVACHEFQMKTVLFAVEAYVRLAEGS